MVQPSPPASPTSAGQTPFNKKCARNDQRDLEGKKMSYMSAHILDELRTENLLKPHLSATKEWNLPWTDYQCSWL